MRKVVRWDDNAINHNPVCMCGIALAVAGLDGHLRCSPSACML
jgi:hypothetical protein